MNWLLALRRHDQGILTKADCGVLRTGKDIASGTGGEGWVEPLNGLDVEIVGRACVAFFIDECIAIRRLNNLDLDVVDGSVPPGDDGVVEDNRVLGATIGDTLNSVFDVIWPPELVAPDNAAPADINIGNLNHFEVAVRARKRFSMFINATGLVHINHGLATDEGHRGRSDDPHRSYLSVKLCTVGFRNHLMEAVLG